jgi:hypothetical protein
MAAVKISNTLEGVEMWCREARRDGCTAAKIQQLRDWLDLPVGFNLKGEKLSDHQ